MGSYQDGIYDRTLVERWNGSKWSIQASPNTSAVGSSYLDAVSCSSISNCIAVGSSGNSNLAESWNGSAWALQSIPNGDDNFPNYLNGVSCSTAIACSAVGSYVNDSDPFNEFDVAVAERWDGVSWTLQSPGAVGGYFNAVACPSVSVCTAVGGQDGSSVPLVERWDGSTWTSQSAPAPAGADSSSLESVSCPSATSCMASGDYHAPGGGSSTHLFIERWNGSTWTLISTPSLAGATSSALYGVSCASATDCSAVGFQSQTSSAGDELLAEHWNGTGWSIQPTPQPAGGTYLALSDVSCPAAGTCAAVSGYRNNTSSIVTLAEAWNGTSWSIQPTVNRAVADGELSDVSCPSTTACTAVGRLNKSVGQSTLAEHWDGSTWVIQPTTNPAGAEDSALEGVSCPSTTVCFAAGRTSTGSYGSNRTLAERWSGGGWTYQYTPNPSGTQDAELRAVSCPFATRCTAVGTYADSTGNKELTLIEHWDGSSWSIQSSLNPSAESFLTGVSCPSSSVCTAVGYLGGAYSAGRTLERRQLDASVRPHPERCVKCAP